MTASDPIEEYLAQLKGELRGRRRSRRRMLIEVRAHLLEAAEAGRLKGEPGINAAARAVERFGSVAQTAGEFNRPARLGGSLARRALVPAVAAVLMTSIATATVWAFYPAQYSPAPSPLRAARKYSEQRLRCERAAELAHEAFPRGGEAFPPKIPITSLPCGRRDARRG